MQDWTDLKKTPTKNTACKAYPQWKNPLLLAGCEEGLLDDWLTEASTAENSADSGWLRAPLTLERQAGWIEGMDDGWLDGWDDEDEDDWLDRWDEGWLKGYVSHVVACHRPIKWVVVGESFWSGWWNHSFSMSSSICCHVGSSCQHTINHDDLATIHHKAARKTWTHSNRPSINRHLQS